MHQWRENIVWDTDSHKPTLSDLSPLLQTLFTHSKAVCLSVMEDYYHHYADPVQPCVVPKSLLRLRDPGKDGCELSVLQQHCEGLARVVAVTETQAAAVEAQTRRQHRSPAWYTSRAGRITASNTHAVVSTSVPRPAMSTVRRVCYPRKTSTTAVMRWGIDHEEEARTLVQNSTNVNKPFKCSCCQSHICVMIV